MTNRLKGLPYVVETWLLEFRLNRFQALHINPETSHLYFVRFVLLKLHLLQYVNICVETDETPYE